MLMSTGSVPVMKRRVQTKESGSEGCPTASGKKRFDLWAYFVDIHTNGAEMGYVMFCNHFATCVVISEV